MRYVARARLPSRLAGGNGQAARVLRSESGHQAGVLIRADCVCKPLADATQWQPNRGCGYLTMNTDPWPVPDPGSSTSSLVAEMSRSVNRRPSIVPDKSAGSSELPGASDVAWIST